MKAAILALFALLSSGSFAPAQMTPTFEVASLKLAPERTGTEGYVAMDRTPSMVRYSNTRLKILIAIAYQFDSEMILGGPAWLGSQKYDLNAKLPPGARKDQIPAMLQVLLAERLKLAVHRETKEQRVYLLTVGKNGPKLSKSLGASNAGDVEQVRGDRLPVQVWKGGIMGRPMSISALAGTLSHLAGVQVVDRTGLTGNYDIDVRWTPEGDANPGPELFAAIREQLGLELKVGRAPVETLVVDHAERVPTAN